MKSYDLHVFSAVLPGTNSSELISVPYSRWCAFVCRWRLVAGTLGIASRLPRLHAQTDAVNRGHADERARLPAVGRVQANGMRKAVHDAVRRGAVEDEYVA